MKRNEKSEPRSSKRIGRNLFTRRNVLLATGIAMSSLTLAIFRLRLLRAHEQNATLETLKVGQQLNRERRYTEAVAEFTRLIESRKDFAEAYLFRGIALFNAGQFAEAIGDFSKTLELDPQNISVRLYRGESYLATGQKAEAAEDFIAVIQANSLDKRLVAAANAKLQAIGR